MKTQKMDESAKKEKKPRHRTLAKASKKAEKATVHKLSIKMNPKQFLEFIKNQQEKGGDIITKVPPKVLLAWRDIEDRKILQTV